MSESSTHGKNLLGEAQEPLSIVCFSGQSDTQDLVRKATYFRDLDVLLEFRKSLSELPEMKGPRLDIVIIEMRGQTEEQLFFRYQHEGEFAQCEIIVLCSGADAKEWHTLVMEREIADYMVVRPLYDAHRLRVQL